MKIKYALLTDKGSREVNEDCIGMQKKWLNYCFVLADGLGGHGCGDIASDIGVKTCIKEFNNNGIKEETLKNCFENSQDAIVQLQKKDNRYAKMKTTEVVLLINRNGMAQWGHIGDSRLYCFSQGIVKEQTLDHSVPQRLVQAGIITPNEIRGHVDRNRLLRAVGGEWQEDKPMYACSEIIKIKKGDAFLLCSDGFWELIEEKTMQILLCQSKNVEQWLDEMKCEVIKNGTGKNMDNYSAIAIQIK